MDRRRHPDALRQPDRPGKGNPRRWHSPLPLADAVGSRGQALPLFVLSIFVLLGFTAIVIDISWYWSNTLAIQRAADAAALAGAVQLPGSPAVGVQLALAEARKNGYDATAAGATCPVTPGSLEICAMQDTGNRRQMNVTITTQVPTFFAQIFGIRTWSATLSAKAQFALPIPMGSPLNYYGVGCLSTNDDPLTGLTESACTQGGNSNGPSGVPNATAGSTLTGGTAPNQLDSQGAWGVVFSKGGDSRNGDAFSPAAVSTTAAASSFVANRNQVFGGNDPVGGYDPAGYSYGVDIPPGGGGSVYIFDAGFCGMPPLGSGRAGTGDEWTTAGPGASNPSGVSTYYNLWQINDPFSPAERHADLELGEHVRQHEPGRREWRPRRCRRGPAIPVRQQRRHPVRRTDRQRLRLSPQVVADPHVGAAGRQLPSPGHDHPGRPLGRRHGRRRPPAQRRRWGRRTGSASRSPARPVSLACTD